MNIDEEVFYYAHPDAKVGSVYSTNRISGTSLKILIDKYTNYKKIHNIKIVELKDNVSVKVFSIEEAKRIIKIDQL